MQQLAEWVMGVDGFDSAADLRGDLSDFAPGSRNLMPDGVKQARPFRDLTLIGEGGRVLFQIKDTWGALADDGATPGKGSLFSTVADMLVYCGQGRVHLETTDLGVVASNVLKFLLKWNGSYTDPNSGPYAAGLPEPLAIEVGIVDDSSIYGTPNLDGTVSIKGARLRSTTGGRSRASATSAVLVVSKKAIYAVAPVAVSGQTHHVFFGTDTKLGGIGLHYRIARANPFTKNEYTEADVERNTVITSVTGGDKLNAASGTFTSGDIGKLVENVSGFTIPAGTTVAEIISSSQIRLSAAVTSGAAGTVTLVSYVNNIRRAVVLNWTPSDLVEETAWIYDFPPSTCSHAFQLESRMFIASYSDASTRAAATSDVPDNSASSGNPGTALIPSLSDNFESYDPRYPIYLPEKVVDVLTDGMESYKFIGGENGIYAGQYLNVTDSAPMTISVLLRGEGIKGPNNWCARERAIYLYTGKGQPVRIIEGGKVDKTFAAKVRREMRDIEQEDMVVFGHPKGGGVVYAAGKVAWFYDEVTDRWSTELTLNNVENGPIVASVATKSRAIICLAQLSEIIVDEIDINAFYFDEGEGSYVVGVSHYTSQPDQQEQKIVQRLTASGEVDQIATAAYIGLHRDTLPTHFKDGTILIHTNDFSTIQPFFLEEMVGHYLLYRSANSWKRARITDVISPTQATLGTAESGLTAPTDYDAPATVESAYGLVAYRIFPVRVNRTGTFEVESGEMYLPGLTSYAMSMALDNDGVASQPLRFSLDGMVNQEQGWGGGSASFNQKV